MGRRWREEKEGGCEEMEREVGVGGRGRGGGMKEGENTVSKTC